MNSKPVPPSAPNPLHNSDTSSTAVVQRFDDGGGRLLDDPVVHEREGQRRVKTAENAPSQADTK